MNRPKILKRTIANDKVGKQPGYLYVPAGAFKPRLFLISFDEHFFEEKEFATYEELKSAYDSLPEARHWIDIRGYGDLALLEKIKFDFAIHPLQLEDVINDYQRPKMEEKGDHLFIVSRMISFTSDKRVDDDQLSIFTGSNYVLTFQSDYEDCLNVFRQRIRTGKGSTRKKPVLYMAYAIMDVIIDNYFPVLSEVGDYLESLEDCLFETPDKKTLNQIINVKREITKIRRIAWSERDKINEMLRDEDLVPEDLRIYFKDAYDHTVQVLDLIENYKEMTGNLTELYLSNVSNRMNEIMKVLTIISSIFIPLSFIASVYGMNFSRENPNGGTNPLNMPELYQPYGYVTLLTIMGGLIIFQLFFFWRKGWLSRSG
ncbi:magnesium/cobalt transporter CorA [Adhaeribacter aquaticus]|uniref:magnesium/cobalt transporter CorA n=1 Tax=Adhaeribacter aquaticus TaxID=299567 RepID=UPI0003F84039|nr:magnesium/cobalt transporter CorA [Adhaeribacter aquaticus]